MIFSGNRKAECAILFTIVKAVSYIQALSVSLINIQTRFVLAFI